MKQNETKQSEGQTEPDVPLAQPAGKSGCLLSRAYLIPREYVCVCVCEGECET